MITTERMSQIIVDLTVGKSVKAKTKEETQFIKDVKVDIAEARELGIEIRIQPEWVEGI